MSAAIAVRLTWQRMLQADERVFLRLRALERPQLTPLMRALTSLGDTSSWALQGLVLSVAAPDGRGMALRLAMAAVLATVVVQVLKRGCRRARPSCGIAGFRALAHDPDAFSFPSGHTAVACAVGVALAAMVPGLGGLELTLAFGVAVSRVYLGAHYPLDVTVGAVIGGLCGLATVHVLA